MKYEASFFLKIKIEITKFTVCCKVMFANFVVKIRPNKKISVFRVTGLKILCRVGTHIIF